MHRPFFNKFLPGPEALPYDGAELPEPLERLAAHYSLDGFDGRLWNRDFITTCYRFSESGTPERDWLVRGKLNPLAAGGKSPAARNVQGRSVPAHLHSPIIAPISTRATVIYPPLIKT
jgi:hypothetical protein